jgi:hypothetical protein
MLTNKVQQEQKNKTQLGGDDGEESEEEESTRNRHPLCVCDIGICYHMCA